VGTSVSTHTHTHTHTHTEAAVSVQASLVRGTPQAPNGSSYNKRGRDS
jgi:hypothetical protein